MNLEGVSFLLLFIVFCFKPLNGIVTSENLYSIGATVHINCYNGPSRLKVNLCQEFTSINFITQKQVHCKIEQESYDAVKSVLLKRNPVYCNVSVFRNVEKYAEFIFPLSGIVQEDDIHVNSKFIMIIHYFEGVIQAVTAYPFLVESSIFFPTSSIMLSGSLLWLEGTDISTISQIKAKDNSTFGRYAIEHKGDDNITVGFHPQSSFYGYAFWLLVFGLLFYFFYKRHEQKKAEYYTRKFV